MTAVPPGRRDDPWTHSEQQLNSRLVRPLLRFYEQQFGGAALRQLLEGLGTTREVLEDPDRWVSAALMLRLNRAMVEATGDVLVIYQAGRALAKPGMLGPERVFMRNLGTPRFVYAQFTAITARYSRITRWEMTSLGPGLLRATFLRDASAEDDILFCGNRRGVLEAVPELFGLPPARVAHPECMHAGDQRCVYEVSWVEHLMWSRQILVAAAGLALAAVGAWWFGASAAAIGLSLAGAGLGMAGIAGDALRARRVSGDSAALTSLQTDELRDLLERNTRRVTELQALQRVVDATRTVLDEEELIGNVLEQLTSALEYDRALLLRVDAGRGTLGAGRSQGFGDQAALVEGLDLALDPAGTDDRLFGHIVAQGAPVLITDIEGYCRELLPKNRALLEALHTSAFVAAPIEGRGAPLGLLVVDRRRSAAGGTLSLRDRDLLQAVAAAVGAALSNARLFRRVQDELLINLKFRQYLPAAAVEEVRRRPEAALSLGGHDEELAVMFCDVARFTAMSASCSPSEVVRGLNCWFGIADPIIHAAAGIVDKRIGDGILVVFRTEPGELPGRHPVERAVAAAVGMQRALEAERGRLREAAPAFAEIQIRHAIHFGWVVLGNIGTQERMEYTVIGDAVNTCARLEGETPAGEVWLTEEAVTACGLRGAVRVRDCVFRGHDAPTRLWAYPKG